MSVPSPTLLRSHKHRHADYHYRTSDKTVHIKQQGNQSRPATAHHIHPRCPKALTSLPLIHLPRPLPKQPKNVTGISAKLPKLLHIRLKTLHLFPDQLLVLDMGGTDVLGQVLELERTLDREVERSLELYERVAELEDS